MSSRAKHMARSHRSHRNTIPKFQQFNSRQFINQSFKRDNTTFAEHMAKMFSFLRRLGKR